MIGSSASIGFGIWHFFVPGAWKWYSYIDPNATELIVAGLFGSLEQSYTTLQSQAPYDIRILEGLKTLYETTGDQAKLADVRVSINILSKEDSGEESEPVEAPDAPFAPSRSPGTTAS